MLAGMWRWQISEFENGQLLIDALHLRVPAAPRAFLLQTIRKGRLRCAGQALAADLPVSTGLCLTVQTSARFEELAGLGGVPPQDLLYEDQHALVVHKPAGLAMHLTPGHEDNLADRVARFFALRHAPHRVAPVHRLDVGTSGPVLFGKGRWAVGQYGRLLMDRRFSKHYLVVVAGSVPSQGRLTSPIAEGELLKPALTRYRCLAAAGPYSLLDLDLVTGRQHQARRQLAAAGWPIVGDRRYGGPSWPGLDHPFLHCHRLCFPALATQQLRQVDAPLPARLAGILAAIGLTTVLPTANNLGNAAGGGQDHVSW
jgi:23S rRNA pseudouridine955/2504/2580 synthase